MIVFSHIPDERVETVASIIQKIAKSFDLLGVVKATRQTIIPYKSVSKVKYKSNIEFETRE